jgi:hypothetical protein
VSRWVPLPGPCGLSVEERPDDAEDDDDLRVVLRADGFLERPPWWGASEARGAPRPVRWERDAGETVVELDAPPGVTLAELEAESDAQGGALDPLVRNAVALGLAEALLAHRVHELPLGPLERGLVWIDFDGDVWWLGSLAALGPFVHANLPPRELLSAHDEAPPPMSSALAPTDPRPLVRSIATPLEGLERAPDLETTIVWMRPLSALSPEELGAAVRALCARYAGAGDRE